MRAAAANQLNEAELSNMPVQKDLRVATEEDQQKSPVVSLRAQGYGDLRKGQLICQRVAESMARAEIAKQLEVEVKELSVDRVREKTGHSLEQDIEITREERTHGLLKDVRIIERHVDEAARICSCIAVMEKPTRIEPLKNR